MEDRIGRRGKVRYDVEVEGYLRTGSGKPIMAQITDLSETGCACTVSSPWMKQAANVSVRIGSLGPIESTVRWVDGREIGLEFHQPVYGPVFEHVCDLISVSNARPDRRSHV